ncbi:MAG: 16S rRNA (uracil(1498)-N(3))-methyltransferase [Candidatus Omnitrophota bacterium]|nr:16S rRNA (uracil(1498)-N(3))-methyltransferase [Candidatus Omnitrophota bacterium]
MNLILLFDPDFISTNRVRLGGRRFMHVRDIHRAHAGEALSVGVLNGQMGKGTITVMGDDAVEMDVRLEAEPPSALPLTLVMALPRPNVLKRTLVCAASLGIKRIILLNFFRVEKSLWNSSALRPEAVREQLILGLEQGKDTVLPRVDLRERFKPFVEDELPALAKGTLGLVAHPGTGTPPPQNVRGPVTLVIGPEGGLIDYEAEKLTFLGFQMADLGPRILRVEAVLPYLVGRIF